MEGNDRAGVLAALSEGMADAVEKVSAAVVRVHGRRRRSGSGVVYAPGMVLTASHVLEREEDVSVEAPDGRRLPARFVGRDRATDLAVLSVDGLDAEPAAFGGGEPRVGQAALAVGRGWRGEGPKATFGVVSAVGGPTRTWRGGRVERYVQTDASPWPGLSGGALVDASGEVIGVLTAGWGRGAAFAVPADLARRTAEALASRGSTRRGYLGILSQPVRLPDGQKAGLSQERGLLVVGVEDGSPAGEGGMMVGDIVTALDGEAVEDTEDLISMLSGDRVGRPVPVGVLRGGETRTLEVTVGERPNGRG